MDYFVVFSYFLVCAFGFAIYALWQWQLKRTALSIVRTQASGKAVAAKVEQDGELMALISEASMEFKSAKEAGEDVKATAQRVIPALMMKYPTVVMKHGKKLLKMVEKSGGIEGLENFI